MREGRINLRLMVCVQNRDMSTVTPDSTHHYFVTAPLGAASLPLAHWRHVMCRAIAAEVGDDRITVDAMAVLPDRLMAVIACAEWSGVTRYRPARPWHRSRPVPLMCSLLPGLTAQRLVGAKTIRERIDHCHYAPVLAGMCRTPEAWTHSTVQDRSASEMLVA